MEASGPLLALPPEEVTQDQMDRTVNGPRKGLGVVEKRKVSAPFWTRTPALLLFPSHVRYAYLFPRNLPSSETGGRGGHDICFIYYQTQVETVYKERLDVFLLFVFFHG